MTLARYVSLNLVSYNNYLSSIVTGAGSGIGLSIVNLLLQTSNVALVVAVDIRTQQLNVLVTQSGSRLRIVQGDVSTRTTSEEAVQAAIGQTGRLDAIILNAGILGPISPVIDGDIDKWKDLFNINFFSLLHGVCRSLQNERSWHLD